MPLLSSAYRPAWYLRNATAQTVLPALLRFFPRPEFERERLFTPDDDFIDIDRLRASSRKLVLIVHGLEASTGSGYIRGMAAACRKSGWNVAAMNLRGVTHAPHELKRTYHSGATADVNFVVEELLKNQRWESLALVGFSLGGNLVIKYAGEKGNMIDPRIKSAVAISVPCDLKATALHLDGKNNGIYRRRFLRSLKKKLYVIRPRLPFDLSEEKISSLKTLVEYDDVFTAPMYGFANAMDYYAQCSSKQFIPSVAIPLLILNSMDDPFFTSDCLPVAECRNHPLVFLETTAFGGHVGFMTASPWGKFYSEQRTIEFLGG